MQLIRRIKSSSSSRLIFFALPTCRLSNAADQVERSRRFSNVTINRWIDETLIYCVNWALLTFLLLLLSLILISILIALLLPEQNIVPMEGAVYALKGEFEARVLEAQKREAEARKVADEARKREEQVLKDLEHAKFYLEKGIQPEVWPTLEEFQLAKNRVQYDPEKLHIAVCGSAGSGKSSLVNAFRGLKNNSPQAARADVVETTKAITRYPDPREELPYKRLVWFDCPGAGTLENPGWQYFNRQCLFVFDIIVLVYDSRFTQIDISIVQNCERFLIPLFIVRSNADMKVKHIMQDLGYDENDDVADDDFDDYKKRARQLLIDTTRKNLDGNLEKAKLKKRDVFIVSCNVISSLVTVKGLKKTALEIDEARLMESFLKMAHARRYGT